MPRTAAAGRRSPRATREVADPDVVVPERLHAGRTHEQRRQERRDALLATALDLFGTQGYDNVSISELCRVSHVTTRYFYEEFGSREELLLSLYDELLTKTVAQLRRMEADPPGQPGERSRERVEAFFHAFVDDRRVARILFVESNHPASPLAERQSQWAGVLRNMVAEKAALFDPGTASPEVWSVVGTGLVGALFHVMADHVTRLDPLPDDVVIEGIIHIFDAFGVANILTTRPDDRRSVDSPGPRKRRKAASR